LIFFALFVSSRLDGFGCGYAAPGNPWLKFFGTLKELHKQASEKTAVTFVMTIAYAFA